MKILRSPCEERHHGLIHPKLARRLADPAGNHEGIAEGSYAGERREIIELAWESGPLSSRLPQEIIPQVVVVDETPYLLKEGNILSDLDFVLPCRP